LAVGDSLIIPDGQKIEVSYFPEVRLDMREVFLEGNTQLLVVVRRRIFLDLGYWMGGRALDIGFHTGGVPGMSLRSAMFLGEGNAGTWLYNAKSLGYKTGRKPGREPSW
jgi:hypothetical protein